MKNTNNNKTILEKIVSFKMDTCIESYKDKKENRETARNIVKNGGALEVIANNRISKINLYNINKVTIGVFGLTTFFTYLIFSFLASKQIIPISSAALIILLLSILIPYTFKKYQCKYLLDEFKKIDEIDDAEENRKKHEILRILQEKEELRRNKSACNLYLK